MNTGMTVKELIAALSNCNPDAFVRVEYEAVEREEGDGLSDFTTESDVFGVRASRSFVRLELE